jgi:hypothetical protein
VRAEPVDNDLDPCRYGRRSGLPPGHKPPLAL